MKNKTSQSSNKLQEEQARLIKKGMLMPGVNEVMRVYGTFMLLDETYKQFVAASSTSDRAICAQSNSED